MESRLIFSNEVKELINSGKIEVIENSYTIKNGYARPSEHVIIKCRNNYGASIIRHIGSYGYERGLWELAVLCFDERPICGSICYDTEITSDVEGYLTDEDVNKLIIDIFNLNENGYIDIISSLNENGYSEEDEKIKQEVFNMLWDIAEVSPKHGNMLMDIVGEDCYCDIMCKHGNMCMDKLKKYIESVGEV